MSMGGEMMEEMYDKKIQEFLKMLQDRLNLPFGGDMVGFGSAAMLGWVISKYKEHFENFGIYGGK